MKSLSPAAQGHLAMLLFSVLVAGSFSLGARSANSIDPLAMTQARLLIAPVAVLAFAFATGLRFRRAHFEGAWRWALIGGLYAVYFILMFEGLKTATPVSAAAVLTLSPIVSAFFGWVVLRQYMTRRIWAAILVGGVGALWVIFRGQIASFLSLDLGYGEAIYFLGCVAHAAVPAAMRKTGRGEPQLIATFLVLSAGFVVMLPWGMPAVLRTDWTALPSTVWLTLFYVALLTTAATTYLISLAAQRLPGSKLMAYTYIVPTWVIGWELAMGGTPPYWMTMGGVFLTIVALVMLLKEE